MGTPVPTPEPAPPFIIDDPVRFAAFQEELRARRQASQQLWQVVVDQLVAEGMSPAEASRALGGWTIDSSITELAKFHAGVTLQLPGGRTLMPKAGGGYVGTTAAPIDVAVTTTRLVDLRLTNTSNRVAVLGYLDASGGRSRYIAPGESWCVRIPVEGGIQTQLFVHGGGSDRRIRHERDLTFDAEAHAVTTTREAVERDN